MCLPCRQLERAPLPCLPASPMPHRHPLLSRRRRTAHHRHHNRLNLHRPHCRHRLHLPWPLHHHRRNHHRHHHRRLLRRLHVLPRRSHCHRGLSIQKPMTRAPSTSTALHQPGFEPKPAPLIPFGARVLTTTPKVLPPPLSPPMPSLSHPLPRRLRGLPSPSTPPSPLMTTPSPRTAPTSRASSTPSHTPSPPRPSPSPPTWARSPSQGSSCCPQLAARLLLARRHRPRAPWPHRERDVGGRPP